MILLYDVGYEFYSRVDKCYYKIVGYREDAFGVIYTIGIENTFYVFKDLEYKYPDFERREGHINRLIIIGDWVNISK